MKREPAKSFQDLIVGQKAHKLVLEVYRFNVSSTKLSFSKSKESVVRSQESGETYKSDSESKKEN